MPLQIDQTRDRDAIERFLRRETGTHLYALADLDDAFWPHTSWTFGRRDGEPTALCLVLGRLAMPIVYAVCPPDHADTRELVAALARDFPETFFANFGPGVGDALESDWDFESHGLYRKMLLTDPARIEAAADAEPITPDQLDELRAFYREAYAPGEEGGVFFEPYMLDGSYYRGIRESGRLVCVAGLHVHSRPRRVAAIGNVATRPTHRSQGLARRATAALCRAVLPTVDHLGLNVAVDNTPAQRCYERLGFEPVCEYWEGVYRRRVRS